MNWLYYLLEANLYLACFYLMYKLLLQRSTFYTSNRYFLISSVVLAFAIPFIQLNFLQSQLVMERNLVPYEISFEATKTITVPQANLFTIQDYLFYGYIIIATFLSFNFIISVSKIIGIYRNGNKRTLNNYTLVELTEERTAFSFFNVLFIHPEMVQNDAVLRHEYIHIKQKHSWDVLLLEMLKICCWFNPVVYFIKSDLTLLHEYIADEKTTATDISKHEYAMFLIVNSMYTHSSPIVNQLFNQSILKSRINMLNKEKTANWARLKYLLAIPLSLGLLCVSTLSFSKSYGYLKIMPQQEAPKKKVKSTEVKQKTLPAKSKANPSTSLSKENKMAPPAIETPPAGKKLKKFPPPIVKPDIKAETNSKENKTQEIEITAIPSQKEVVVQGYKIPANNQSIQKVKDISLEEKTDAIKDEVVVVGYKTEKDKSTQKVKSINLENKADADKEVVVIGYKTSQKAKPVQKVERKEIAPTKKVQ